MLVFLKWVSIRGIYVKATVTSTSLFQDTDPVLDSPPDASPSRSKPTALQADCCQFAAVLRWSVLSIVLRKSFGAGHSLCPFIY
jgi:hypothetical protein